MDSGAALSPPESKHNITLSRVWNFPMSFWRVKGGRPSRRRWVSRSGSGQGDRHHSSGGQIMATHLLPTYSKPVRMNQMRRHEPTAT